MIASFIIPTEERLNFLPSMAEKYLHFENLLYHFAEQVIEGYNGGYWEFVGLSNGGQFVFPKMKTPITLDNPNNFAKVTLSDESAGICIMLVTLSNFACHEYYYGEEKEVERLSTYHALLMEYAQQHSEWDKIEVFID